MDDPDMLKYSIQNIDVNRRVAHEAAIASVNSINRYAIQTLGKSLFDGDLNNRYNVAQIAVDIYNMFYEAEKSQPKVKDIDEFVSLNKVADVSLVTDAIKTSTVTLPDQTTVKYEPKNNNQER